MGGEKLNKKKKTTTKVLMVPTCNVVSMETTSRAAIHT